MGTPEKSTSDIWRRFPDFLERFFSHTEPARDGSSCLIWVGAHDPKGYGNTRVPRGFPGAGRSRTMKAHRVSVALFRGVVLGAAQGHHRTTCSKDCVHWDHVEGVRPSEHYAEHHPEADVSVWMIREEMVW